MDLEIILDAAGTQAPGLRPLARRFPRAEAGHLGVPLEAASVLVRRAEGAPEVHITGAADALLSHLAADPAAVLALARAGALLAVNQSENAGAP